MKLAEVWMYLPTYTHITYGGTDLCEAALTYRFDLTSVLTFQSLEETLFYDLTSK
jgi:hypothetical protein